MTADCACASPKLTATSASNAVAQSGALNVARFIIDAPCGWKLRFNSGRLGQGPSANNFGYTAPYSGSPQYRNPPPRNRTPPRPARGRKPASTGLSAYLPPRSISGDREAPRHEGSPSLLP